MPLGEVFWLSTPKICRETSLLLQALLPSAFFSATQGKESIFSIAGAAAWWGRVRKMGIFPSGCILWGHFLRVLAVLLPAVGFCVGAQQRAPCPGSLLHGAAFFVCFGTPSYHTPMNVRGFKKWLLSCSKSELQGWEEESWGWLARP